jgi:hypothetical protein
VTFSCTSIAAIPKRRTSRSHTVRIHAENGKVGGVFCPVIETTDKVIGERRLRTLRDLAAKGKGAKSEPDAYQSAAAVLATNSQDVPFALIYRVDRKTLQCGTGGRGRHRTGNACFA